MLLGTSPGIGAPLLGVNVWIDLSRSTSGAFVQSHASRRFFLPVPLTGVPTGIKVYMQSMWLNTPGSPCPVPKGITLSATDGLEIIVR